MSLDLIDRAMFETALAPTHREESATRDLLGRIGHLETRLARNEREIAAAQSVRYRVFVEEMKAQVSADEARLGREIDHWDALCDHLLVLDRAIEGDAEDQIVGTYRLLRHDVAIAHGGFYSGSEFGVGALVARHPHKRFMELGRSCVLPQYRNKRTLELLWQGCWAYALQNRIDAMFGCGSFPGVRPEEHALALSYLHHHAQARGDWAVDALPHLARNMDLMPPEAINPRRALLSMPPLIKGYLRAGAMVGHGAVVDQAFNTTDVLIILPISSISGRYINYYGADAGRFACES